MLYSINYVISCSNILTTHVCFNEPVVWLCNLTVHVEKVYWSEGLRHSQDHFMVTSCNLTVHVKKVYWSEGLRHSQDHFMVTSCNLTVHVEKVYWSEGLRHSQDHLRVMSWIVSFFIVICL